MKRLLYSIAVALSTSAVFFSCSGEKEQVQPVDEIVGKWVPEKVELIQVVPLYQYTYPHTAGCEKDFLEVQSTTQGTFTHYTANNCAAQVSSQAFSKKEDEVKININGVEVSGKASFSNNQMYITGNVGNYTAFFQQMFPEYAQMISLLNGATVKMTFNKK